MGLLDCVFHFSGKRQNASFVLGYCNPSSWWDTLQKLTEIVNHWRHGDSAIDSTTRSDPAYSGVRLRTKFAIIMES